MLVCQESQLAQDLTLLNSNCHPQTKKVRAPATKEVKEKKTGARRAPRLLEYLQGVRSCQGRRGRERKEQREKITKRETEKEIK